MEKFTELYYNKSKKSGMSIAYAIVSLVIVAIAVVALTPVLTRKLPNLATSSAIKHPKGWYESYNAPDEGTYYCEQCRIADECAAIRRAGGNCCKQLRNKYNLSCSEGSDNVPDTWPTTPEYVKIESTDNPDNTPPGCYGNPSCLPFIKPGTSPEKIRAFDRYCKPNGKCTPPKPCDGTCKFKPPAGVTKYVVYAIGGGGGSGSAVAANVSGYLWSDISGNYNKIVGGRNNYDGVDKYSEYTPIILPKGADASDSEIDDSDNIVDAHFIDMNRKNTAGTAYNSNNFVNDQSNRNNLYPNRLQSSTRNPECATGILYTVGDESRNFHIYPTEDADNRLARNISDRQIKRILKEHGESENKTYKIGGSLDFHYYNRYYLYTHELGVYDYNQNPVYSLMPEWIKLRPTDKKYPTDADFHKYIDGTDTSTYCNNKTCDIDYYSFGTCGHDSTKTSITAITSKYKTVAAVACSGDGQAGAHAHIGDTDGMCEWMKPTVCPAKEPKQDKIESTTIKNWSFDGYDCPTLRGTPPNSVKSANSGDYCYIAGTYDKQSFFSAGITDYLCKASFSSFYINRYCQFDNATAQYVECSCNQGIKIDNACERDKNKAIEDVCRPLEIDVPLDKNFGESLNFAAAAKIGSRKQRQPEFRAAAKEIIKDEYVENTGQIQGDVEQNTNNNINSKFSVTTTDENGNESTQYYAMDSETGKVYPSNINGDISDDTKKGEPVFKFTDPANIAKEEIRSLQEILMAKHNGSDVEVTDINYNMRKGAHAIDKCWRIKTYYRDAEGGSGGSGICAYVTASINKGVSSITVTPYKSNPNTTANALGYTANYSSNPLSEGTPRDKTTVTDTINNGHRKSKITYGATASSASACINNKCATASGGKGGQSGYVTLPACSHAYKGDSGENGTVSNGGSFPKSEYTNLSTRTKFLKYSRNAHKSTDTYPPTGNTDGEDITGTQKQPGIYNFRYIWYMPFVTKHLLFGTAGSSGEELIVTVTLSEGQTLETTPGKGANKTNYMSGTNGLNGEDSRVTSHESMKINLVAHGGKGGIGSQKTDEYLLCHISDLQGSNPKLPCYAKSVNGKIVTNKKTHYYENGKFKGIQAIKPKVPEKGLTVKMSEALKGSNPGIGAMGFGTESVSDFVCEERHVDKLDQVEGEYGREPVIRSSGIQPNGKINKNCKGNSRIRYILPNTKDYASSTGAVIIMW